MKMKDLKIGTQLKLGFGIIVFLILILSGIAFRMNNQLAMQTTSLLEHPFTVSKAIGRLNLDIMAMRLEFRNLILATDENERQTYISNSDLYEADAKKQFEILYDQYLGPRSDIEKAEDGFLRWVSVRKTNRDTKNISEAMKQLEVTGDIGKEREQMLSDIRRIEDFAAKKSVEFASNAVELKQSMNLEMGILVSVILLLSILIVYILNRIIRKPVDELTQVAQLFREGEMSVRSRYISANEYGILSAAINDLADTIETEMTLANQATKLSSVMLSKDDAHRFCHDLLKGLLENTDAQMGAVYLLNEEKSEFYPFECIGIDMAGCKPFSVINYEGEFGLALSTRKLQLIKNIPDDTRFIFPTVGGKFVSREIITIPIISGDETIAMISLATIKSFNYNALRLLNTILSTMSARIDGILAYRKIISFSQKLEQQNTELELQKRELSAQTNMLTNQNAELEMQKKQLDEANRMKTSFLSNMSHELRTPLNSVIALSGVLNRKLEGKVAEQEYSYLEVIERNGKQLLALINDILDLSRIEAGREELEVRKFRIGDLIDEVIETIRPQASQKNISIGFDHETSLPEISSDYGKCRHILQNLVANAVKFTEEGGVKIWVGQKNETIQIGVNDTGIGISSEHLPHIFDEFRQADGSSSRKYGGTGLGLAIARKYAHMLGGSIHAESIRNEGSTFVLTLPIRIPGHLTAIHQVERETPEFNDYKNNGNTNFDPHEKTILLVEDSESIIIQMKEFLSWEGYNVLFARNGEEALALVEERVPDGMILDLMMPKVDGFEVLKQIRENEKTMDLPVIILTAKIVTKQELSFLKGNGIQQLIRKGDINKSQLLEAVARMVFREKSEVKKTDPVPFTTIVSEKPVVMIVEENDDNLLSIKALLDEKYTILEAVDGFSAIELARVHRPRLILMDYALPGMNGVETMQRIRMQEGLEQIPVIAVSASAMKGDRENFIILGFNDYISKPIDYIHFEKAIQKWLNPNSN